MPDEGGALDFFVIEQADQVRDDLVDRQLAGAIAILTAAEWRSSRPPHIGPVDGERSAQRGELRKPEITGAAESMNEHQGGTVAGLLDFHCIDQHENCLLSVR